MSEIISQPVIILVHPQLGENIGKTARAMLNFGLSEMRLVAPRDGWPNPDAGPAAAGADEVLDRAKTFETLDQAVADLNRVFAATIRTREMVKRVVNAQEAAAESLTIIEHNERVGILFGPERSGLTNDDMALADTVLCIPVNPKFSSLNLSQAVIIYAYEYFRAQGKSEISENFESAATKQELQGLFGHIEDELDARGYFRPDERKSVLVRTVRNIFQHAGLTSQQIQTMRGVIKSLVRKPDSRD